MVPPVSGAEAFPEQGFRGVCGPKSLFGNQARENSLLWLGDAEQGEPHARQAIAWYQEAPPALQDPSFQAQAQINLGVCLVRQDQPEEGVRLAADVCASIVCASIVCTSSRTLRRPTSSSRR